MDDALNPDIDPGMYSGDEPDTDLGIDLDSDLDELYGHTMLRDIHLGPTASGFSDHRKNPVWVVSLIDEHNTLHAKETCGYAFGELHETHVVCGELDIWDMCPSCYGEDTNVSAGLLMTSTLLPSKNPTARRSGWGLWWEKWGPQTPGMREWYQRLFEENQEQTFRELTGWDQQNTSNRLLIARHVHGVSTNRGLFAWRNNWEALGAIALADVSVNINGTAGGLYLGMVPEHVEPTVQKRPVGVENLWLNEPVTVSVQLDANGLTLTGQLIQARMAEATALGGVRENDGWHEQVAELALCAAQTFAK